VTEEPDKEEAFDLGKETPEFGPCMNALNPQQRRAVLALFLTRGVRTEAMRIAGYSQKSAKSVKSHASYFFRQERVRAAVREVAEHEIAIVEPELLGHVWDWYGAQR